MLGEGAGENRDHGPPEVPTAIAPISTDPKVIVQSKLQRIMKRELEVNPLGSDHGKYFADQLKHFIGDELYTYITMTLAISQLVALCQQNPRSPNLPTLAVNITTKALSKLSTVPFICSTLLNFMPVAFVQKFDKPYRKKVRDAVTSVTLTPPAATTADNHESDGPDAEGNDSPISFAALVTRSKLTFSWKKATHVTTPPPHLNLDHFIERYGNSNLANAFCQTLLLQAIVKKLKEMRLRACSVKRDDDAVEIQRAIDIIHKHFPGTDQVYSASALPSPSPSASSSASSSLSSASSSYASSISSDASSTTSSCTTSSASEDDSSSSSV